MGYKRVGHTLKVQVTLPNGITAVVPITGTNVITQNDLDKLIKNCASQGLTDPKLILVTYRHRFAAGLDDAQIFNLIVESQTRQQVRIAAPITDGDLNVTIYDVNAPIEELHVFANAPANICQHVFVDYQGFNESYRYCSKCDVKDFK